MQRLVKKYGSYQHVVAWESILDITIALQKYVEVGMTARTRILYLKKNLCFPTILVVWSVLAEKIGDDVFIKGVATLTLIDGLSFPSCNRDVFVTISEISSA